jgi:hypothetical protein
MQKIPVWQMEPSQQGWFSLPQPTGRQVALMQSMPVWQVLFAQHCWFWPPQASHVRPAPQIVPAWQVLFAQHG